MPFSVYRFTEFEVFWPSTVSVYRSRTLRIPHLASIVSPTPHPAKPMLNPQFRYTKTKNGNDQKIIRCDYGVFIITHLRLRKHRPIFNSFSRTMTFGTSVFVSGHTFSLF